MKAPICPERYQELDVHGHRRIDPYYWLNDREDEEVIQYLNEENAFCKAEMKETEPLQKVLYEEIVGRINKNEASVPYLLEGYYRYLRYEEGKEYPIYARKYKSLSAPEEVILDHNKLAEGKSYSAIWKAAISPDDQFLLYSEDQLSRRIYSIYITDKTSNELLKEISGTSGGFIWSANGEYLFYVTKDEQTLRPNKVFRQSMRGLKEEPTLISDELDEGFYLSIRRSKSKEYLLIERESYNSSETEILSLSEPDAAPQLFLAREENHEYAIDHRPGEFFIKSNRKAQNFQLWRCAETNFIESHWELVIEHRNDTLLQDFELYQDKIVIEERANGLVSFQVLKEGAAPFYIPIGEGSYTAFGSVNVELESGHFRYGYTSLKTPPSVIDYDFETGKKVVQKTQEVIGGYEESKYETERLWASSSDGQQIPISIVYHKEHFIKGQSPVLLYGYGSYGVVVDPSYSTARLSLLDRGFAFAIAHIRGGEYLGRSWYENGKLLHKKNTFNDFISCGKYLVEEGIAPLNNLHAMGGSAGGLLMGAVINEAPTLWKSVVAAVPFVDVLTTMLDDTIPLTVGEYVEWGNPNEKEYYDYMLSYSPYDNVKAQDYPALLVTTGLHDSQVQYWEPAKWVAKLRKMKTDQNRLLLWCNMETGHGGASGRYEYYKEIAMEYAFLLREAGKLK